MLIAGFCFLMVAVWGVWLHMPWFVELGVVFAGIMHILSGIRILRRFLAGPQRAVLDH
jgi:hypothetical protein